MIYERTDFMPFIDVKTNVTFSKEKADELMKELSGSLKAIAKSEAYVMCAVNDGLKMSFQGSSDEPAAIVEVKLLGKGTKDGYAKVTENICNIMQTNGIKVYDSNIALTERLIADIKAKQTQGMALKNDVTRYELQMESLKLGKRQLEDQKSILSHQLCNALGIEDAIIVPDIDLTATDYELMSEKDLQSDALVNAPQIRQSELATNVAEQQLRLAKSELLPKVAVVAADNFTGPFTYDIPPINKNFNVWYVGVGVKYSLSSLFKTPKSVRRAEAQLRQSQEAHAVTNENVNNQVHQAYTMHQQAYVELRTQQKSVELANQNFQVVQNRYVNQLALITDMIDASNVKLNAELQEVNAQINIAYTYYNVKYVTGKI